MRAKENSLLEGILQRVLKFSSREFEDSAQKLQILAVPEGMEQRFEGISPQVILTEELGPTFRLDQGVAAANPQRILFLTVVTDSPLQSHGLRARDQNAAR